MRRAPIDATLAEFERRARAHFLEAGEIRYHFMTYGLEAWRPEQALVVCLHGYKNNLHSFADLIPRLERPALALDLRGFGRSRAPDAAYVSFNEYLCDLKRVLDHLEVSRVALIGHSMGARLAAAFAAVYPERVERVVMIEGFYALYAPSDWPGRLRRWLDQVDTPLKPPIQVDPERLEAFFLRQSPDMPGQLARHIARYSVEETATGEKVTDWAPFHQRPTPSPFNDRQMREALLSLTVPTLVLQSETPALGAPELELETPHMTFERVRAGHQLHWDAPEEVAERILRWWFSER